MSSPIKDVAEAVTDAINAAVLAGTITHQITAIRKWLPTIDLSKMDGIECRVVARSIESSILTRADDQELVAIDVGLWKVLSTDDETEADAVFELVQQINGVLRKRMDAVPASYVGRSSDPIFDVTEFETKRVLRTRTTYTYRVLHDVRL